ncbi:hypothetical protein ACIQAA_06825 [Neobacillus sp. NPDC093182]|uniref:hypothetical protein n=1 Tax=Neobacillus sp. NPDC093182 TaxID=3364297 RepID=UPI0038205F95
MENFLKESSIISNAYKLCRKHKQGRTMLKLGSEKSNNVVVKEFMEKVEQEALKS